MLILKYDNVVAATHVRKKVGYNQLKTILINSIIELINEKNIDLKIMLNGTLKRNFAGKDVKLFNVLCKVSNKDLNKLYYNIK